MHCSAMENKADCAQKLWSNTPCLERGSHDAQCTNLIVRIQKGRLLVKEFGLNIVARVKRQVLMSDR